MSLDVLVIFEYLTVTERTLLRRYDTFGYLTCQSTYFDFEYIQLKQRLEQNCFT